MHGQSLGDEWFRSYYPRIRDSLKYAQARDEESRDLLSDLLAAKGISPLEKQMQAIQRKTIAIFGAGPSLDSDLEGLVHFVKRAIPIIVAADGAADVLNEAGMNPSIIVSDLDSCSQESLEICSQEGLVLVHAHGDNISLIEKIVPKLGSKLYGTTQVSSVSLVTNFGGLTDGDRACFVMSYFEPSSIIIAGMDFGGAEGKHSKNRYVVGTNPQRPSKLQWGKRSLEFLIQSRPDIRFANATKYGEEIAGAPKVSYEKITSGAF